MTYNYLSQLLKSKSKSKCFTGGDTYQEGMACYRLGNAHEEIGEYDVAIKVFYYILWYSIVMIISHDLHIHLKFL